MSSPPWKLGHSILAPPPVKPRVKPLSTVLESVGNSKAVRTHLQLDIVRWLVLFNASRLESCLDISQIRSQMLLVPGEFAFESWVTCKVVKMRSSIRVRPRKCQLTKSQDLGVHPFDQLGETCLMSTSAEDDLVRTNLTFRASASYASCEELQRRVGNVRTT